MHALKYAWVSDRSNQLQETSENRRRFTAVLHACEPPSGLELDGPASECPSGLRGGIGGGVGSETGAASETLETP